MKDKYHKLSDCSEKSGNGNDDTPKGKRSPSKTVPYLSIKEHFRVHQTKLPQLLNLVQRLYHL